MASDNRKRRILFRLSGKKNPKTDKSKKASGSKSPVKAMTRVAAAAVGSGLLLSTALSHQVLASEAPEVTIRVCSWEEYIDLGGWDEDETIDLPSGDIIGENSMIEDFEKWYFENYGIRVKVEYSTFGTNEDLYNMITLGDVYDLVCPSEYMFMKLMAENRLEPLSEKFFDESCQDNYYIKGVSPFIRRIFQENEINGESWEKYAAGYMWGVTGIVYNPEQVSAEAASSWDILNNREFYRQVTLKDNVRDSYFSAVAALKHELLTSESFTGDPSYHERLKEEMNDTSPETIAEALAYLKSCKDNAYSFETDSGKADMITGKVLANLQWSGDAVYTMDQADEDDFTLAFSVPEEVTNIYFDGWCLMKNGVAEDSRKQAACEAFINFLSRPDNAVRNMNYIGYTSVIAGEKDDKRIFEYARWNYGAEDDDNETIEYPLGYFFSDDNQDDSYVITAPADQANRQLFAQYPTEEVIERSSIMEYFDASVSDEINQMWINVRCYSITSVPPVVWILLGSGAVGGAAFFLRRKKLKKY